ncbi:MAG TPA: lysylphosphatidylglycerol synthase transmembrane domain-containing protein [Candidatus Saccharimonadales bacterium]|nr:lysylphosphatidylglycerol synthase transmembrane domain-containing protein [Candidatus Saccharimonadales bacterium]
MGKRFWISLLSLGLVILVLFFGRHQLERAWELLSQVNIWILLLLIPAQLISYHASGEIIFSYLNKKHNIAKLGRIDMTKLALEFNFVNHILPTGGVSGASYMTWRLKKLGVSSGRATMALFVRFAMGFAGFLTLLLFALFFMAIDDSLNRLILLASSFLGCAIILISLFVIFVIGSRARLQTVSHAIARTVNRIAQKLRLRRQIKEASVVNFFSELHQDYVVLRRDPKILLQPYLWGIVFNIFEIVMFMITFWALGTPVNPAPLFIAYGLAVTVGAVVATPGGTGGYEAVMILFLAAAGLPEGAVVAGVVLTRAILIVGTILTGYIFYQLAIAKYGKHPTSSL